jgi:cobaltochelatase CobN
LVLYKDLNDKDNLKNQILYILNYLGFDVDYENPTFTGSKTYGIYRDRWYSLDEYVATFFNPEYNRTVGVLESTMYIESQQLHTCYSIIESLESRGYNVIPVFAAGGSSDQLKVMVESWTSAGDDIAGFLANSSNYETYIDAIVSMVAYGVGGENFTKALTFLKRSVCLCSGQSIQIMFQTNSGNWVQLDLQQNAVTNGGTLQ